jgi:hypothetical protein
MRICFPGLFESRKTWWISSSISAKGGLLGFYCCLGTLTLGIKAGVPPEDPRKGQ